MVVYPQSLPMPLREGYGFQPVSPLRRSNKVSGRSVQRRLYKSVPTVAAVRWIFSESQALAFEAWFEDQLVSGSQWFECPLKVPGGIGTYKARFVDIYEGPTQVGISNWSFSASLELWERPILKGGWGHFPEIVVGAPIIDWAINKEWPGPS
ncbi:hypothetical protein [Pseudomonas putida]|uniref:hypothetical protein n=1 Tax=Pseudomonas putida TaxID=303 RepID=UPI00034EFA78|nr:hypothetical protein [Pseudomonas putida]AGN80631.1 membrane protein [Pseudomonas putida H8234]HDS1814307.1 hypothetical protein [Pseudomonas putida]HDS3810825.1 hypothetical protein [Pseudomonas putida]